MPLLERFQELNRERLPLAHRYLVGYSGGPDSTALLHLMVRAGYEVVAAHLHHGMRPEADEEANRAETWAKSLGIQILIGHADVPTISAHRKIGIEEAGREARYEFFRQASAAFGCDRIATAHTLDDHVETILFQMTRGGGLAALSGIPFSRDSLVRPLLEFTKADLRAYCTAHELWFHDDPANTDVSSSRVRIRSQVLPALTAINPRALETFARTAETAREENEYLDEIGAAVLEQTYLPLNGELEFLTHADELALNSEVLRQFPAVARARAIRRGAQMLGVILDHQATQFALHGLMGGGAGALDVAKDFRIAWQPDRFQLMRTDPVSLSRHPLTTPGVTESEIFGWQLDISLGDPNGPLPVGTRLEARADFDSLSGPLHVRAATDQDKITPLGMREGSKFVREILAEMKLTPRARRLLPIVCDMVGPVWVPGGPLAERVRLGPASKSAVVFRFGSMD